MVEFAELEQRILAAFARIGAGVEVLGKTAKAAGSTPSAAQSEEIARLQAALDAEREARLAAEEARAATSAEDMGVDLGAEVERLTRQLDAQGLDSQRLRSSVAQLREELRRLREATETGLADAPLINRALQAELEALRAVRASETTEMADILAALGPVIDAEEAQAHAGH
jgi:predicted  nucleic acid-binding Zn-ribbon protein